MSPRHVVATIVATIILSISSTSMAQDSDLVNSRRSSYYTFIYRLNNQEAEKLFTSMRNVDTTYFNDLHDFYPTDSLYTRSLPVGHYLFVNAISDDLKIELRSVNNLPLHLLDNARDLVIVLSDVAGNEPPDAEVRIRNKVIPYDKSVGAYRLPKTNRRGIVSVLYDGHASYFEIDRQYNNTFAVRTGKRIIATFPINHLISPMIYIKDNVVSLVKWGRVRPPGIYHRITRPFRPKPTKGYMVFNKPMFKPGDTVRLKAMVTTTNGRPMNKRADVFLASNHYGGQPAKKLATITPFRKGAYEFTFVLVDTLNLRLDNTYQIQLKDHKGNFLQTNTFQYEDYELKNNVFSLRTDQGIAGKPSKLYLKGEDTNSLPVFNVRTEILLKPLQIEHHYTPRTFIPDTLWYHETRLGAVGERLSRFQIL